MRREKEIEIKSDLAFDFNFSFFFARVYLRIHCTLTPTDYALSGDELTFFKRSDASEGPRTRDDTDLLFSFCVACVAKAVTELVFTQSKNIPD